MVFLLILTVKLAQILCHQIYELQTYPNRLRFRCTLLSRKFLFMILLSRYQAFLEPAIFNKKISNLAMSSRKFTYVLFSRSFPFSKVHHTIIPFKTSRKWVKHSLAEFTFISRSFWGHFAVIRGYRWCVILLT